MGRPPQARTEARVVRPLALLALLSTAHGLTIRRRLVFLMLLMLLIFIRVVSCGVLLPACHFAASCLGVFVRILDRAIQPGRQSLTTSDDFGYALLASPHSGELWLFGDQS